MNEMKNLMIYISPTKSFNNPSPFLTNDNGVSVKIQIENSLALGWKPEDILLYTNFEWQYGSFKARQIKDVEYLDFSPQASKFNAIVKLFDLELIEDKIYWFHDLDAFQLAPIIETELKLDGYDMGLTDYHNGDQWNTASIFFKQSAKDIFHKIKDRIDKNKIRKDRIAEEVALTELTTEYSDIKTRIKKMNLTYNFAPFAHTHNYESTTKPIKVAHFHPERGIPKVGMNTYLLPDRLIKIFKSHRINPPIGHPNVYIKNL